MTCLERESEIRSIDVSRIAMESGYSSTVISELIAEMKKIQTECCTELNGLTDECNSLEALINNCNKEIEHFSIAKKEAISVGNSSDVSKLEQKVSERQEVLSKLDEQFKEIDSKREKMFHLFEKVRMDNVHLYGIEHDAPTLRRLKDDPLPW